MAKSTGRSVRRMAGVLSTVTVALLGCGEAVSPSGQRGPTEPEPRAGAYVVAEFDYLNSCADPSFGLNDHAATVRSATFEVVPTGADRGNLVLTGVLRVANPVSGAADIEIFEGPDTGTYRITGDTLRLSFPKQVNEWVGVLRFARYQAGQLAGASRTRCRSLSLRLEKLP